MNNPNLSSEDLVILVDANDQPIGTANKLIAHQQNLLHRAFSVFLFHENHQNQWEVLIQQRAAHKYHSPNLWTNACCSHPRPGESILEAAERRLEQELGIYTPLKRVGHFTYQATFDNGLSEHEFDHVLIGIIDHTMSLQLNPDEVQAIRFIRTEEMRGFYETHQMHFTRWFIEAYELAYQALLNESDRKARE